MAVELRDDESMSNIEKDVYTLGQFDPEPDGISKTKKLNYSQNSMGKIIFLSLRCRRNLISGQNDPVCARGVKKMKSCDVRKLRR